MGENERKPIIEDAAHHPWKLGCVTCQREAELALAKLKDAAEPFHRLDVDMGDEWRDVCEPLREALVAAGEVLRTSFREPV